MKPKSKKIDLKLAAFIGEMLCEYLLKENLVERARIVGSVRRKKSKVGDVEILYIPKYGIVNHPGELFPIEVNLTEMRFQEFLQMKILRMRKNKKGSVMWGNLNKLALFGHARIPLDLFACTPQTWFCNLVCRTGSAEVNTLIAQKAKAIGMKWRSTGEGFEDIKTGKILIKPKSEKEVFDAVGIPYYPPETRHDYLVGSSGKTGFSTVIPSSMKFPFMQGKP